ncbi:MAG: 50S ribosomal protein L24e [Candidatus Aenigmatarchaeota archaeon]
MAKCSFCNKKLLQGTGKMFVLNSNVIKYFCSRKCEKSWHMGRDSNKLKWAGPAK